MGAVVGNLDGAEVGGKVAGNGDAVGLLEGEAVGLLEGGDVGLLDGDAVGLLVGDFV